MFDQLKSDETDIWGCDDKDKIEKPSDDFNLAFDQTFNKRIEDELFGNEVSTDVKVADEKMFKMEPTDLNACNGRERQKHKPQRQDTLSGNNPFRMLSFGEEDGYENVTPDDESPFMLALKAAGKTNLEDSTDSFDPLSTIYPESGDEHERNAENYTSSKSSDSGEDSFIKFKDSHAVRITEPNVLKENNEVQSILSAPSPMHTVKGPRERKLPPESKSPNPTKIDDLFSDLRIENDKKMLDVNEDPQVIRFESPLSGNFSGEQIVWETLQCKEENITQDDSNAVWGEEVEFKAEFEPLPHEIVTFEPFNAVNENLEWKLLIRQPEKKSKTKQMTRYTSNRWWKDVYIKLAIEKERPCLKFFENFEDSEPYRVVRLEPYMQLSRDKLQQYDKYGKLHIFKLNHVVYKEMVGMRTEKFSLKTLQNLVSHKPKMNIVLDHMPLRTEVVKFGSLDNQPIRSLMSAIEDSMMLIKSHRDTSLEYTKEEVCCYINDEYACELSAGGSIIHQKARSRILFAAFVMGEPHIVLGINDKWRFGNEIVRRQDIIPIVHDNWITIYEPEFHSCIDMEEYEKDHMIKFYPLDGCKFELMRFRVPLRANRELPLTAEVKIKLSGVRVDIRVDLSVPGFFSVSKRHGAVHCDDVEIRVPIPEEWAYHFRVENSSKFGSVHSALRKPGKIKGFERITQLAQSFLPASMLEASIGIAKYEHLFRAIVWRIPRCPEKNEAAYMSHVMTCKFVLAPHDSVPATEELSKTFHVEYTMSASTISGATVRSISVEHSSTPERFVKYLTYIKNTRAINYEIGEPKPSPITSVLDETKDAAYDVHSSDESRPEKSCSETGNSSPSRSHNNDSWDLLAPNPELDSNVSRSQPHSAIDDLLTLDCFAKSSTNFDYNLDDIAMVDDLEQ